MNKIKRETNVKRDKCFKIIDVKKKKIHRIRKRKGITNSVNPEYQRCHLQMLFVQNVKWFEYQNLMLN